MDQPPLRQSDPLGLAALSTAPAWGVPHRITLRFAPWLEEAYSRESFPRSLRLVRLVDSAVIVTLYLLEVSVLVIGIDELPLLAVLRRLVVGIYILHFGLTHTPHLRRLIVPSSLFAALAGVGYLSSIPAALSGVDRTLANDALVTTMVATVIASSLVFALGSLGFLPAAVFALCGMAAWSASAMVFGAFGGLTLLLYNLLVAGGCLCAAVAGYLLELHLRLAFARNLELRQERRKSEALLLNILPAQIAARLRDGERPIADDYSEATVLFADICGFTEMAAQFPPTQLVSRLNEVFSTFDAIAQRHGLEKIKTIGDAYMLVAGIPTPREDHLSATAAAALEMRDAIASMSATVVGGDGSPHGLALRMGIHTGSVVAGVIGTSKFAYDLWGDTVNTASRMESHGVPGEIQLSQDAARRLPPQFDVRPRGVLDVKGKGRMETYLLCGVRSPPASPSARPDSAPSICP